MMHYHKRFASNFFIFTQFNTTVSQYSLLITKFTIAITITITEQNTSPSLVGGLFFPSVDQLNFLPFILLTLVSDPDP